MRALWIAAALTAAVVGCKDDPPAPNVPDAPVRDAAPDAPSACFLEDGTPPNCFDQSSCEPEEPGDFLNGCTSAQCIPFDNVARLPRYNNGNLPQLP